MLALLTSVAVVSISASLKLYSPGCTGIEIDEVG